MQRTARSVFLEVRAIGQVDPVEVGTQRVCSHIASLPIKKRVAGNWTYVLPEPRAALYFTTFQGADVSGKSLDFQTLALGYDLEPCRRKRAFDLFDLCKIARFHSEF